MTLCRVLVWVLLGVGLGLHTAEAQLTTNPFAVEVLPVATSPRVGEPITLQVTITVPPDHYLYADATTLQFPPQEGVTIGGIRYPESTPEPDPFLGRVVAIYNSTVTIEAKIVPREPLQGVRGMVTYQGCSQSICFRRMTIPVTWGLLGVGNGLPGVATATATAVETATPAVVLERLFAQGALVTYGLTFLGGILTSFTPCVLPMIPVILLIIGIQPGVWRRNLQLSTSLAAGIACTAAVSGAIAAVVGLPLAFLFQQRWFVGLVMLLFLLMALSMFGLFTFRLPQALERRLRHLGGKGPRGAFLAGVSTGILATPCAGPVVAALITYVGVSGDLLYGFSLLLTYGVGFALIFIVVGTFYGHLASRLPHGRLTVVVVKVLLGLLLLLPVGYYGWVLWGGSTPGWHTDLPSASREARTQGRPILIEFTAKSCPPCLVMERTTFRDRAVLSALHSEVVPLRLDMTFPRPEDLALADRYGVVGWPALLFASPQGEVFPELSFIGKIVSPAELLHHIARAKVRVNGL